MSVFSISNQTVRHSVWDWIIKYFIMYEWMVTYCNAVNLLYLGTYIHQCPLVHIYPIRVLSTFFFFPHTIVFCLVTRGYCYNNDPHNVVFRIISFFLHFHYIVFIISFFIPWSCLFSEKRVHKEFDDGLFKDLNFQIFTSCIKE